jgi:3-hydroxybutyryl-CoA dehydratase
MAKPFEEYSIGETFESYARTITEADIVNFTCFAGLKMPMFIDEEYCRKHSVFKTRIAPGMMTASIAAGMMEDIHGKYVLAGLGIEKLTFTAPVIAGDTLHTRITVTSMRPTSDGKRGVLVVRVEVLNQKDETPLEFTTSFMMKKGRA